MIRRLVLTWLVKRLTVRLSAQLAKTQAKQAEVESRLASLDRDRNEPWRMWDDDEGYNGIGGMG